MALSLRVDTRFLEKHDHAEQAKESTNRDYIGTNREER